MLRERFWSHVDRSAGPNACWPWRASRLPRGYGKVLTGSRSDGTRRMALAHRVALELSGFILRDDDVVMHRCDNPPCCNPAHLSIGTAAENSRDAQRKGRNARGEQHGAAKLREQQVAEIRRRLRNGERGVDVAREYGISQAQVCRIARRQRWRAEENA